MYNQRCGSEKRDLEKQMDECGWRFHRHGGKHDYWTNGEIFESVPRHKEVNEMLSKNFKNCKKQSSQKVR